MIPKVLGLIWDILKDTVRMHCELLEIPLSAKRSISSAIAFICDHMG
ncbi:hypothetical protein GCK32_008496 [Trichostrongylus colubriformis]|uniref:Uncharacterized protein n=1 Tax=Trichostrongylus colubriformis TaxID=6319 RepID=A0AAN8FVB5_TRICO